ncbi:MAG: hypothetical protein IPN42_19250 [Methylococcaceae bacterium]|nr:hypothetical protein [Methylococcaceae bacterium]
MDAGAGIDTINVSGGRPRHDYHGGAGKDTVITGTGNDKMYLMQV